LDIGSIHLLVDNPWKMDKNIVDKDKDIVDKDILDMDIVEHLVYLVVMFVLDIVVYLT